KTRIRRAGTDDHIVAATTVAEPILQDGPGTVDQVHRQEAINLRPVIRRSNVRHSIEIAVHQPEPHFPRGTTGAQQGAVELTRRSSEYDAGEASCDFPDQMARRVE